MSRDKLMEPDAFYASILLAEKRYNEELESKRRRDEEQQDKLVTSLISSMMAVAQSELLLHNNLGRRELHISGTHLLGRGRDAIEIDDDDPTGYNLLVLGERFVSTWNQRFGHIFLAEARYREAGQKIGNADYYNFKRVYAQGQNAQ